MTYWWNSDGRRTGWQDNGEEDGILYINPGSLTYPRGDRREKIYAELTLTVDHDRDVVIKVLQDRR